MGHICLRQQKYMGQLKRGATYEARKISRNVGMVRPLTNYTQDADIPSESEQRGTTVLGQF